MKSGRGARRGRKFVEILVACTFMGLFAFYQGCHPPGDPCDGVLCSGHGVCASLDDEPVCLCDDGYVEEGLECVEAGPSPCTGVTCSGHGVCVVRDGKPLCVCDHGYCIPPHEWADCEPCFLPCEAEDGTLCNDGLFCTLDDICLDGVCVGVSSKCDDGDPCTVDLCNEDEYECTNTPIPDGSVCDDGLFCTIGELCIGGVCGDEFSRSCSDGNLCTEDFCDEENQLCVNDVLQDGTECDDGLFCTTEATCTGGVCEGGIEYSCSDGNQCTEDFCDDQNSLCVNEALEDGTPCDDGAWCTVGERCTDGICGSSEPRDCSDGIAWTYDVCVEELDMCAHYPDGFPCEDGLFCTVDSWDDGECRYFPRACLDENSCTADTCDEENAACVNTALADGVACDDGLYCWIGETCTAGGCGGGEPRSCDDGNECTTDICDEAADTCVYIPIIDGPACD